MVHDDVGRDDLGATAPQSPEKMSIRASTFRTCQNNSQIISKKSMMHIVF